jgi:hypothetical protein
MTRGNAQHLIRPTGRVDLLGLVRGCGFMAGKLPVAGPESNVEIASRRWGGVSVFASGRAVSGIDRRRSDYIAYCHQDGADGRRDRGGGCSEEVDGCEARGGGFADRGRGDRERGGGCSERGGGCREFGGGCGEIGGGIGLRASRCKENADGIEENAGRAGEIVGGFRENGGGAREMGGRGREKGSGLIFGNANASWAGMRWDLAARRRGAPRGRSRPHGLKTRAPFAGVLADAGGANPASFATWFLLHAVSP